MVWKLYSDDDKASMRSVAIRFRWTMVWKQRNYLKNSANPTTATVAIRFRWTMVWKTIRVLDRTKQLVLSQSAFAGQWFGSLDIMPHEFPYADCRNPLSLDNGLEDCRRTSPSLQMSVAIRFRWTMVWKAFRKTKLQAPCRRNPLSLDNGLEAADELAEMVAVGWSQSAFAGQWFGSLNIQLVRSHYMAVAIRFRWTMVWKAYHF